MNILKSKKIIWIIAFLLGLILLFFFFPSSIIGLVVPEQPSVIWWNFDLNQMKIPVWIKNIDFIFSDNLKSETINKKNITISPNLEWSFSLINSNIVRFNIDQKINIWDNYLFSFSDRVEWENWKNINEANFNIEFVSNASVLKINPEWSLQNLNQNFSVFFSVPMVSLTDLDSRDNLPCPIEFEPKIKGKCSWTTTSVLEFIPDNRLKWATDYRIRVINKEWLLFPLINEKEVVVSTPRLNLFFNDKFSVREWISFTANFDVSLDEIKNHISIYIENDNSWKNEKLRIEKEISNELSEVFSDNIIVSNDFENKKENFDDKEIVINNNRKKLDLDIIKSNNNFNIQLKNWFFDYDRTYFVEISKWLKTINWNIPLSNVFRRYIKSYWFLNDVQVYKNIYSDTWALINTKFFYTWDESYKIPVKDLFLNLNFEEEVQLNKDFFEFKNNNWKKINFDLSYIKDKKYDDDSDKYITFLNKKKVKIILKNKLENDSVYSLIIKKDINKFVKDDIIYKFNTSKKLEVKDFTFINYSKSCLYLNNSLDDYWKLSKEVFYTEPESRKVTISDYDYIPYDIEKKSLSFWIKKKTFSSEVKIISEEWNNYLEKQWYCRTPKKWEFLYVLNTRLNPNSEYKLIINNEFEDKYWNKLDNKIEKKWKTGDILDKDKYLYSSVSKDINVIPNNLPIVVNLETINLNKVELEVCEMDEKWFIDYDNNNRKNGFKAKCLNNKNWFVDVKNHNWNLTFNKIDLEKDFLKRKFKSNFILVRGKVKKKKYAYEWQDIAFENIYIRSNISVAYENWVNKKLLFVTDFKWNFKKNISFKFYKWNWNWRYLWWEVKEIKLFPKLNKNTNIFELNDNKEWFDYILAYDKDNNLNIWFLDLRSDHLSNYWFKYISWETTSEKKYLYLYTDRPIYKPGDTVYFKWLLREFKSSWYVASDIKNASLELVWPSWKTIDTKKVIVDKNSNFSWEFIIPNEVDLWKFRFRFITTKWKNNYTVRNNAFFNIEEYKKPVFKINIENNKKSDFIIWESIDLSIKPQYYFWWKMYNTTWEYSVLTQNYFFDAKDYSDYNFWDGYRYFDCIYWGYCNYADHLDKTWKFNIDNNWVYNFKYSFKWDDVKWEKIYNFSFDIKDPDTKKVVSKTVSKVLHNTDSYIWIKSKYYNSFKKWIDLDWVILDFDAKPRVFSKAKIELIKRNWKSVKKKWVDWVFYNEYSLEEKLESTYKVISDKKWLFFKNIKPKTSWEYEIKAIYRWKNWKEFISSKIIYVAWDDYVEWHNWNNDITEFVAEKVQVKVWDKAEYMLKSPINTWKALIVIEKDSDILDYFIHDINSYSDKITINVKDNYYPNYYLKAFLIWSENSNPLPVYKRALVVTKVNTEYKKLNISIKTDKKSYLPWEVVQLDILVKDYNWNPVKNSDVSISLVDESVLALKWNPKKNPYAFFYDLKRYLWISTYSSLKNLIEKLEVKDNSNWEKWWAWDQIKWWDSKKKRWVFKDTAFWRASWMTDENWVLRLQTTKLPDNLTTWVIEVLANTKKDTKIWVNYITIKTSKKLLLNDNLPSFFGSNDTIILSPVIFNKTWKNKTFNVYLDITNAEIISDIVKTVKIVNGWSKTVNFKIKVNDIWLTNTWSSIMSKVNIRVASIDLEQEDEIEKYIKIVQNSTPEYVSTFWKTNENSFQEKINLWNIIKSSWKLTINYSVTLLNSILDWIDYLNRYPYWCSEQKTSAIMPNVFIKKLYSSIWKDFDLKSKMIKYWAWKNIWYKEKSLDQILKEYLVNIREYQKNDGGFVYFYDLNYWNNYSDFWLSSYILKSWAEIRDIWYKIDEKTYFDIIKYLKTRFYKNYREWCIISQYNNCKYSEIDRLKAISAILSFDDNDYEAYKMYKILNFTNINNAINLEKVKVIAKLIRLKQLSTLEKYNLKKEAKQIINNIISNELVFNPKWAYLAKNSYYTRLKNTTLFLEAVSEIWLDEFKDIDKIIDNVIRWIIWEKKNGSFGSTLDNISVIKSIIKYLENRWDLKDIKNYTKIILNNNIIEERIFNNDNKLEVYTKELSLDKLKDENNFVINKAWNWTIYYDLNLIYYKNASNIKACDEWFFIETKYYKYEEYKNIELAKKIERKKYLDKKITYDELLYPKDVFSYLNEVNEWKVWDLLIVKNKIITTETRDKVVFEWFIPAWCELINNNLDTSVKKDIWWSNLYFNKLEYRTDRLFAYKVKMNPWIYDFKYLIRLTNSWEYSIKPTKISEFYNTEVFWRNKWRTFIIQ